MHRMEDGRKARRTAKAAFDEFARTQGAGLSVADGRLLARFRDEDNHALLGKAWPLIEKYRKRDDDDQLLIKNIFSSWHFAQEAPSMLDEYATATGDFQLLRRYAEKLHAFFSGTRLQASGEQTTEQVERLLQSLTWAMEMFDRGQQEISMLPERLGLSRELDAFRGPRVTFTTKMTVATLALFGRPLDEAVAALASIVFQTDVTVDQVRSARIRHVQRNA
jgi:hypothetical protein